MPQQVPRGVEQTRRPRRPRREPRQGQVHRWAEEGATRSAAPQRAEPVPQQPDPTPIAMPAEAVETELPVVLAVQVVLGVLGVEATQNLTSALRSPAATHLSTSAPTPGSTRAVQSDE